MTLIGGGRILRVCDLCGGVDDHPRHVVVGQAGDYIRPNEEVVERVLEAAPNGERARLVAELLDTAASDRHMHCCRDAGCPDQSCDRLLAEAGDARGADLLAFLIAQQQPEA